MGHVGPWGHMGQVLTFQIEKVLNIFIYLYVVLEVQL